MQQQITDWLQALGLTHYTNILAVVAVLVAIVFISLIIHLILHKCLLPMFKRRAEKARINGQKRCYAINYSTVWPGYYRGFCSSF